MSGWTKSTYKKHVVKLVKDFLGSYDFFPSGEGLRFERVQSPDVSSFVSIIVVSGKTAEATIELDVFSSIILRPVADICERLFGRERSIATVGGSIGQFTKADAKKSEYRFNWNVPDEEQIRKFESDLVEFLEFSKGIHSVKDLDAETLARIPNLRKNFSQGLGETYKYTAPEVAAIIHKLNSHIDKAVFALEVASKSRRLSEEQLGRIKDFVYFDLPRVASPI